MITIALLVTNLICVGALVVQWRRNLIRHDHRWTDWSDWSVNQYHQSASFIRSRFCATCKRAEQQEVGMHMCRTCRHLEDFMASFDTGLRISRLEEKLWGQGGER